MDNLTAAWARLAIGSGTGREQAGELRTELGGDAIAVGGMHPR